MTYNDYNGFVLHWPLSKCTEYSQNEFLTENSKQKQFAGPVVAAHYFTFDAESCEMS